MFAADLELTPDLFTQAIEANLLETFTLLGSSIGELIKADETIGFFTGVPIPVFNGVVSPLFAPDTADMYIDFFIDQARSRRLPMMWQVGPSSRPADIGTRLIEHGFVGAEDIPGMAVELAALAHGQPG